jgi:hypothetical protein
MALGKGKLRNGQGRDFIKRKRLVPVKALVLRPYLSRPVHEPPGRVNQDCPVLAAKRL